MFKGLYLAIFIALFLSLTFVSYGESSDSDVVTITFKATADTYIDEIHPDRNYGSRDLLHVRSLEGGNARILLFFNLSVVPPGADVVSATLSLYLNSSSSLREYLCHRVSSSWSEDSVTWEDMPERLSIFSKSVHVKNYSGWVSWDVTDHVQKFLNGISEYTWANYGWEISDGSEGSSSGYNASFCSREFSEEYAPTLTLVFRPPRVDLVVEKTSLMAGEWVKVTVKRVSQDGIIVHTADRIIKKDWISRGNLIVKLSSSSSEGFFSLTKGGDPIDEVVISDGSAQVTVYYYDSAAGEHVLSVGVKSYPPGYYVGDSEPLLVVVDTTPPTISSVRMLGPPLMSEPIRFSVSVSDEGSGVMRVTLYYSTSGGETWNEVEMLPKGEGVYEADVPPQRVFTEVLYRVKAWDFAGNAAETPTKRFTVGAPSWVYMVIFISIAIAGSVGALILKRRHYKKS